MSSTYIDKVSKIKEDLPEIVDLDNYDYDENRFPYDYICPSDYKNGEKIPEWIEKVATRRTIRYTDVDLWAACEKIFGKRPGSARYCFDGRRIMFDSDGNKLGEITPEMLKPHEFIAEKEALIYARDHIGSAPVYNIEIKEGEVDYDTLVKWAEESIRAEDEYYSYIGEQVWLFMKAAVAAKDGNIIIVDID